MKRIAVELLTDQGNIAVIRVPGRRIPGVVVQGDSLSILVADAEALAAVTQATPEVHELAQDLAHEMSRILAYYSEALAEHGIALPYTPTATAQRTEEAP